MTVEQEALLFAEQNGFSAPLTAGIPGGQDKKKNRCGGDKKKKPTTQKKKNNTQITKWLDY